MLPGRSPPHHWLSESEPLLFDDEFCQNLIENLQSIPTPPQSPPIKTGSSKTLSSVDQLEIVSELLLEESDFLPWNWHEDNYHEHSKSSVSHDCSWPKSSDGKMGVLSKSPLLSDIDMEIFKEIAGSMLDCGAACEALMEKIDSPDTNESSETFSDYGSLSAAGESSDSEDEIDVVTVHNCNPRTRSQQQKANVKREQQQALKRCHLEIQQQHNYAAPRPVSPPPPPVKRVRGNKHFTPRNTCYLEDDEERRKTHNVMERQRRNELKNCFLRLRNHVPELSYNDKASKVMILKRAKESIHNLETERRRLCKKRDGLRKKQEQLKARLEHLESLSF